MPTWNNCKYDNLFYDKEAAGVDWKCSVEITEGHIRVWYDDEDENGRAIVTTYEGKENGVGHFELSAPSVNGRATLHMFDGGKILEGFWVEGGEQGMWRIKLA
ncbi:MAG: hypothetical protein PHE55_06940 [Methylococcaceae bacterium]|nr:hypothetical protein [Methylococcaceae bacterium]